MANATINKVVLGSEVLLDLTADTVTPQTLAQGYTAHDASGRLITGEAVESDPPIWQDNDGYVHVSDTAAAPVAIYAEDGYVVLDVEPAEVSLQSKTRSYTPSETAQGETITADQGYDGLGRVDVSVAAIPSSYVGSGVTRRTPTDLTASGATVTAPAGYYSDAASADVASGSYGAQSQTRSKNTTMGLMQYGVTWPSFTAGYISSAPSATFNSTLEKKTVTPSASAQTVTPTNANYYLEEVTVEAMPSGTAGTPTAAKGGVSNHQISVTPSVTNSTGYITGGTKNGTPVTVSASELVSGTLSVTQNGTVDVTSYASASVNVPSNDFVVTLSYNDNTEMWEPDCTYAEAYAAYQAGKTFYAKTLQDAGDGTVADGPASIQYVDGQSALNYSALERFNDWAGNYGYTEKGYFLTSTGISQVFSGAYQDVSSGDAQPADVAQGMAFYNADGYQVGTASGGASNFVQGTFTTSATTGAAQAVSIPYTGSGHPVFARVEVAEGLVNSDFYNAVRNRSVGYWTASQNDKSRAFRAYDTANMAVCYKSTTAQNFQYGTNISAYFTGPGASSFSVFDTVAFTSPTQLSVFVSDAGTYGLMPDTEYLYYIVYSE